MDRRQPGKPVPIPRGAVNSEARATIQWLIDEGLARVWIDEETGREMFALTEKGNEYAAAKIAEMEKTEEGRAEIEAIKRDTRGDA